MSRHGMEYLGRICLVGAAVCLIVGCGVETDIGTRYELEKAIWRAEQFKKAAVSDPLSENRAALRASLALYEDILETDRFRRACGEDGRDEFASDIRRLLLKCKIALAELYFVEYEDCAGVTYPGAIVDRHDLLFTIHFGLSLKKVRAIYAPWDSDSLEVRCAGAFKSVADDTSLWLDEGIVGDTLLALPIWLAGVQRGREETRPYDYARAAEDFYSRLIQTRPDDPVADQARVRRAELYVLERRFEEALGELDTLLATPSRNLNEGDLLLWKGEILAHGIGRHEEAERILEAVVAEFPRSAPARSAVLNLAELEARRGHREEAVRMLRELELDPGTPREIAATAMLLRALLAERGGDWPQAVRLLWRVCHLESFTRAAAVSPGLMVGHYAGARDSAAAEAALRDAGEFYVEAIGKHIGYLAHPHILKDFLIESYLIAGKPKVVAELLEAHGMKWRTDDGCVGLYKSALIYLNLLHDEENGVRMLQKCLDLFPTSRYAWIVRAQLDRIPPISDEPR